MPFVARVGGLPFLRLAGLLVLAPLLAACPALDAPSRLLELRSVEGRPLPAVLDERVVAGPEGDELHRIEALEGTLRLDADGDYEIRLRLRGTVDGHAIPLVRFRDAGEVVEAGGDLAFASAWFENLAYRGARVDDGVTVALDLAVLVGAPAIAELLFAAP